MGSCEVVDRGGWSYVVSETAMCETREIFPNFRRFVNSAGNCSFLSPPVSLFSLGSYALGQTDVHKLDSNFVLVVPQVEFSTDN